MTVGRHAKRSGARSFGRFRFGVCPELQRKLARRPDEIVPPLVSSHDSLDKVMTHDIHLVEMDEADSVNTTQDFEHLNQATLLSGRQVDLRNVAGDHHFRIETDTSQNHLHLLGRRVLRLVYDDEAVV